MGFFCCNYKEINKKIIYKKRRQVLDGENIHDNTMHMIESVAEETAQNYISDSDFNKEGLLQEAKTIFNVTSLESLEDKNINEQKFSLCCHVNL